MLKNDWEEKGNHTKRIAQAILSDSVNFNQFPSFFKHESSSFFSLWYSVFTMPTNRSTVYVIPLVALEAPEVALEPLVALGPEVS